MTTAQPIDPTKVCEDLLRKGKAYNIEHNILPSENRVTDRLLARRVELMDAYAELYEKLHARPHALETFLGVVVNVAAFWNPERISASRDARGRIGDVNAKIAENAAELAELLDERSDLHNHSGFSSGTHYHIAEVIDVASAGNGYYRLYLKEDLDALRAQYDLKYWPSLGEVARAIGEDAEFAGTDATNPLTRAATTGSRASKADFFEAPWRRSRRTASGITAIFRGDSNSPTTRSRPSRTARSIWGRMISWTGPM